MNHSLLTTWVPNDTVQGAAVLLWCHWLPVRLGQDLKD